MFVYSTIVHLRDTDVTGVLYFSEQFNFALQTFEAFLKDRGFAGRIFFPRLILPVVHAEGDYLAPLICGDALEISFQVAKIGTSSITCRYTLCDPERKIAVGKVEIIHVVAQ